MNLTITRRSGPIARMTGSLPSHAAGPGEPREIWSPARLSHSRNSTVTKTVLASLTTAGVGYAIGVGAATNNLCLLGGGFGVGLLLTVWALFNPSARVETASIIAGVTMLGSAGIGYVHHGGLNTPNPASVTSSAGTGDTERPFVRINPDGSTGVRVAPNVYFNGDGTVSYGPKF